MKKTRLISFLLACFMLATSAVFVLTSAAEEKTITFRTEVRNSKIYGIAKGATVAEVRLAFYDVVVEVYDKNGTKLASSAKMATGYTIKLNGVSYAAVVMGDVNGNGDWDSLDYLAVKREYFGTGYIGSLGLEAAGIEPGGKASVLDYIKIKRAVLGTYNMNYKYTTEPYNPNTGESGWNPDWV